VLFCCYPIVAQLRYEVKDINQLSQGDGYYAVKITIFAWNLGAETQINSILQGMIDGLKSRGLSTSYHEEIADFSLWYKNPLSGSITPRNYPASIMIKTIYDSYISMESPKYGFPSTGVNSGQEWSYVFLVFLSDIILAPILLLLIYLLF
jgi:hypothetical protein